MSNLLQKNTIFSSYSMTLCVMYTGQQLAQGYTINSNSVFHAPTPLFNERNTNCHKHITHSMLRDWCCWCWTLPSHWKKNTLLTKKTTWQWITTMERSRYWWVCTCVSLSDWLATVKVRVGADVWLFVHVECAFALLTLISKNRCDNESMMV